jgi:FKBP-type peptidyl-prolyl cis-trans isomerase
MKRLKQILIATGMLCCFVLTLKAQDPEGDKMIYDREMLEHMRHMQGYVETPSGLMYLVYKMGNGPKPKQFSKIILKYDLANLNTKVIEDYREKPWEGTVDNTLIGFQEALKMMPEGSKWMVYLPSRLCVNKKGKVGGGRVLTAYLQLISVKN